MGKHSGNMTGGKGDDAIQQTMLRQVEEAAASSVPMIGANFRPGASGELELVIVGKHPLGLKGVAIHVDPINALLLASSIADGIAQSMLKAAQSAAQLGSSKPQKVD